MASRFAGFPPEAIQFFKGLARNNNRDWFQARKPIFDEKVKQPMREFIDALNGAIQGFAPEFVTDPEKAMCRFYRDTRFSHDKTPYKDHVAASFRRRGAAPHHEGGYYVQFSHKDIGLGGGAYMPQPEVLLKIRQHIAENHKELRKILAAPALRKLSMGEVQGDKLTRVPKGFDAAHPAADLLRFKSLFLYTELDPGIATTPQFFTETVARFRAVTPFIKFLTDPLGEKKEMLKLDPRDLLL